MTNKIKAKKYGTIWLLVIAICFFTKGVMAQEISPQAQFNSKQESSVIALNSWLESKTALESSNPKITLNLINAPLKEVLRIMANEFAVSLYYNTKLVPDKLVSLHVKDMPLSKVLQKVLGGTFLKAVVSGRSITLHKMEPKSMIFPTVNISPGLSLKSLKETISGTVTDVATDQPLIGVSILVVGTSTGTTTDAKGHYSLTVPSLQDTLRFSYIGYKTKTVAISGRNVLNISLERGTQTLSQMVVTATGRTNKEELGTNVTKISSKDIEPAAITNTQDILGNVPGVEVLANSGQPGAGGTIRLRGNISITQNNNPIVYINGIRINTGYTAQNSESGQSPNPLNIINPHNIESISVVKGPAATTLYGSEAAGGVIRITTKKGTAGYTIWNVSVAEGFNNIGHFGPTKNNPTGLFMGKCRGKGLVSADGTRFQEKNCPDSGSWLRNGLVQRYNLSVSSGSENFTYFLSANYNDSKGVIYHGGWDRNIGLSGNFSYKPNENVTISYYTKYNRGKIKWVPQGNNGDSFILNVTRGLGSHFAGALGCKNSDYICIDNSQILDKTNNNTLLYHYINKLSITAETGEHLQNRVTIGLDYNNHKDRNTQYFGYMLQPKGEQSIKNYTKAFLTLDYLGKYRFDGLKNFSTTLSWGAQFFRTRTVLENLLSRDFSGPQKPILTSGAHREITGNSFRKVVKGGIFSQVSFSLYNKLFVKAGARYDGNSTFGSEFGWQFYPQLSASFILSRYDFWPASWWNKFRIRAAIGEAGQSPGPFQAKRTYLPIAGDNGKPGFTTNQIGNPELGPEVTRGIEAGFNTGFFDGRVKFNFTYFNQKTRDALIPVPGIPSKGFISSQLRNVGLIKNTGVEAGINLQPIRSKDIVWDLNAGFSVHHSKVLDLAGINQIVIQYYGRSFIREGYPVPAIFGLKVKNPDQKAAPVYTDEKKYYGPNYPNKIINMGTSLHFWRGIILSAKGILSLGGYMINADGYQNSRPSRQVWAPCYDIQRSNVSELTAWERAKCAVGTRPKYDNWIESTDYFRLKNLSITYNMSDNLLPQGITTMSLTLSANNLFTITDYTGTDPTINDYRGSLARRDYYAMPTYRTFLLSLDFSF